MSERSFALYAALEVAQDADAGEIKQSYRFKEISFAYEVLSDPERRSHYDEKGPERNLWIERDALFYSGPPRSAEELSEMLARQGATTRGTGPGGRRQRPKSKEKFVALAVKVGHVTEDLEVYVPMGSAHGDTILFRGKADEQPDCETGNLLVVVHEEAVGEHSRFQRRGADLYMKMEISLAEAGPLA
eukprot:Skav236272  [mRNA]  locus=scaffold2289:90232:96110:+ [translate_table: standard]